MKIPKVSRRKWKYIPDLLRPSEVEAVLHLLNINWPVHKVNKNGWVKIHNPFRNNNTPSFSLNIKKGCFRDFAVENYKGDLLKLIMLANGFSSLNQANEWLINNSNINIDLKSYIWQ